MLPERIILTKEIAGKLREMRASTMNPRTNQPYPIYAISKSSGHSEAWLRRKESLLDKTISREDLTNIVSFYTDEANVNKVHEIIKREFKEIIPAEKIGNKLVPKKDNVENIFSVKGIISDLLEENKKLKNENIMLRLERAI